MTISPRFFSKMQIITVVKHNGNAVRKGWHLVSLLSGVSFPFALSLHLVNQKGSYDPTHASILCPGSWDREVCALTAQSFQPQKRTGTVLSLFFFIKVPSFL